jgi:hypothetical protein
MDRADLTQQENYDFPFSQPNSYVRFLRDAETAVAEHLDQLLERISQGSISPGMWHPNGFATFKIRLIENLGLIRLHIWPQHMRRRLEGHPEVHRHSFDLYSRVIAGNYIESQYMTHETDDPLDSVGLRKYTVQPGSGEDLDVLVESETRTSVNKIITRQGCPAGSWHDLEAGAYHATEIPGDTLCATLAILGQHHPAGRDVLVGQPGFLVTKNTRALVTNDEIAEMSSQLRTELNL